MDFNLKGTFCSDLDIPIWIYSDEIISKSISNSLKDAFFRVQCMFIAEIPFLLTTATGRERPANGQISRDVFFGLASEFTFGKYTLVNDKFWSNCFPDKNFEETLFELGQFLKLPPNKISAQLCEWRKENRLHYFNVFL